MKTRGLFFLAASLICTLPATASVTNVVYQDDGDGGIVCPIYTWPGGETINIYGDQYFGPGHIEFNVDTDTELDPTLTLVNSIDNDTGGVWNSFQVDIWMNKTFTISGASVLVPVDWSVTSVLQPVFGTAIHDGNPVPNVYVGHLLFSGGTPVPTGGTLEFSYAVSFLGSISFTEQLIPIPEPSSLSFVALGLLFGCYRLARRKN